VKLLFFLVLTASAAGAQFASAGAWSTAALAGAPATRSQECSKPRISNVRVTSTATAITVTWNTATAASTQISYGYLLPSAAAIGSSGLLSSVTDNTSGVTSHSVVLSGLWPSTGYSGSVISESVNGAGLCGSQYRSFGGTGDTNSWSVMTSAAPAGTAAFEMRIDGPLHVAQGFGVWLAVAAFTTQGTIPNSTLKTVVTGLPSNVSLQWYIPSGANSQTTTTVTNDTLNWYQIDSAANGNSGNQEFNLVTNSGGTTAPGVYTLTFTTSGSGVSTAVKTYSLTVDAHPFSNTAFPSGTPSSYPAIPCLMPTSTTMTGGPCASDWTSNMWTYGAFNSRQDEDLGTDPSPYGRTTSPPISGCVAGVRCIAPNHTANLCVVSGAIQKCSWYYDGMHVYQAIATRTREQSLWQQAINNVKQVYLPYVTNAGQVYTFFPEGIYEDWSRTNDPADKTALDTLASRPTNYSGATDVLVQYLQRENAYTAKTFFYDQLVGSSPTIPGMTSAQSLNYWIDHVLGHMDQICWSRNAQYWQTFIVGLQANALLRILDGGHADARILPAVKACADYLWTNSWNAISDDQNAFAYSNFHIQTNCGKANCGISPNGILNLLVAPMYARIFKETGLTQYQTEGDTIWQCGVQFCDVSGGAENSIGNGNGPSGGESGKAFSENYYWSSNYVTWRSHQ
jgi:hypothetical protein